MLGRGVCSVCIARQITLGLWWTSGTLTGFTQSTSGFLCQLSSHTDIHRSIQDSINVAVYRVARWKDQILYQGSGCMNTILPTTNNMLWIIVVVSIIEYYYLYQYYFSLLLQYASKQCLQGSKSCLHVGLQQALKSIIARWFSRNLLCISHQTTRIKTNALSLTQNGENLVHEMTFELERIEKSSSNFLRTLCKWTPLSSYSLIF